ncbi:MAG: hypothetical protein JWM95_3537, partial [Gemmatimonadetes bacterium]|nr:hypothetical protein [Gemmatimonadota bacterium]
MRFIAPRFLVALAACVVALSCGDVPTFAGGIVYISPIVLPSPSVAAGDQLRDSTGKVAPLQVIAYDTGNVPIPNLAVTYVISSVPAGGATIDDKGFLKADDSVRTLQIVARIGSSLQTSAATLEIVPQPDALEAAGTVDSLVSLSYSSPIQVKVSGVRGGTRVPVKAIVVRYQITKVNGLAAVDSNQFKLVDDAKNTVRGDPRTAVDTTDVSGVAGRVLLPIQATFTSVEV